MDVNKLKEYFAAQSAQVTPTSQESINEMIERRRKTRKSAIGELDVLIDAYTKEQLQHLAGKVGVKSLLFLTRDIGQVQIKKVWEDELEHLADILRDYEFYQMGVLEMPEFIHKDLLASIKERRHAPVSA